MIKTDVIIAGAGAAGLMTALTIGKQLKKKAEIIILDHKDKPGKKLLATGNGRCNFTNDILDNESYRGNNPSFAYNLIDKFSKEKLIDFFNELGIRSTSINGYYYPRSLQASTIIDTFMSYIDLYNIKTVYNEHIADVLKNKKGYRIITNNNEYCCKYFVLATGGKSYKTLGSDGSGYNICKSLGHTITPLYPSLCGLEASGMDFKLSSGVRAKGRVKLIVKDKTISTQEGEIQFADYGVSGIPIFQISRYASENLSNGNKVYIEIDLVREYEILEVKSILVDILKNNKNQNILNALNAFIPLKLAKSVLKRLKINISDTYKQLDNGKLLAIASDLKHLKIKAENDMGFEKSQVTAGGINTSEIEIETLESKISDNLFITGEILDIDGNCGGYNLHFAFACGKIAGETIAERINNDN